MPNVAIKYNDSKKLGNRLRSIRKEKDGRSLEEFGKSLGLKDGKAISKMENGSNTPALGYINFAIKAWNANANWLIANRGPKFLGEEIRGAPRETQGEGDTGGDVLFNGMEWDEIRDVLRAVADTVSDQHPAMRDDFIRQIMNVPVVHGLVSHEIEKRKKGEFPSKKRKVVEGVPG
jgi:transcriptional regulator with XRE-family HTH domain